MLLSFKSVRNFFSGLLGVRPLANDDDNFLANPNVTILCCGQPDKWPRYNIIKGDLYWTGDDWSTKRNKAMLYASFPEAAKDWKVLRIL